MPPDSNLSEKPPINERLNQDGSSRERGSSRVETNLDSTRSWLAHIRKRAPVTDAADHATIDAPSSDYTPAKPMRPTETTTIHEANNPLPKIQVPSSEAGHTPPIAMVSKPLHRSDSANPSAELRIKPVFRVKKLKRPVASSRSQIKGEPAIRTPKAQLEDLNSLIEQGRKRKVESHVHPLPASTSPTMESLPVTQTFLMNMKAKTTPPLNTDPSETSAEDVVSTSQNVSSDENPETSDYIKELENEEPVKASPFGVAGFLSKIKSDRLRVDSKRSRVSKDWAKKVAQSQKDRQTELRMLNEKYASLPSKERAEALGLYEKEILRIQSTEGQELDKFYQPNLQCDQIGDHIDESSTRKAFKEISRAFHARK